MGCVGISDERRVAQLILRNKAGTEDLIVLDILPQGARVGPQGITLGQDLSGLWAIPTETPLQSWAYQEGATPSRWPRKKERRPLINLVTKASTVAAWEDMQTLLWSVLSIHYDCWLRLYDATEGWRELQVRLLQEPPDKSTFMYGHRGQHTWECPLLACDPFWYSEPFEFEFSRADMTPVSGGYEIEIEVTNPTDQVGFLEWNSGELTAAAETWSFEDGDSGTMIELPALSGAGKSFWVQTYPDRPQLWVRDLGQDWANMRSKTFTKALAPITPTPRTIKARLVGGHAGSSMMLTVPRRWDRPIGGQLPIVAEVLG